MIDTVYIVNIFSRRRLVRAKTVIGAHNLPMNLPPLVDGVPPGRLILWVGAGVSYPTPTSLPLGIPLAEFALRVCCGESVATRVRDLWGKANSLAGTPGSPLPLGAMPRLESILGDIDDVRSESPRRRFDFLQGFGAFTAAPINTNHVYVAELLRRGADVVTTNFDTCVEEAYRLVTGGAGELELTRESGTTCYRSRNNSAAGRIWHVHGTAHDVRSLGATIRAVKEGLPRSFRELLDGAFSGEALVVFLGYGAGDSFDVNLYFGGKRAGEFASAAAWFVQHPGAPPPPGAALAVRPFGRNLVTAEDTTSVLASLAGGGSAGASAPAFSWEEAFLRRAVTTDVAGVRGYLICKLAFTLGVNVDLLDRSAYADALRHEADFDSQDFNRTLAYVCRVQGKGRAEKRHDLLSKRGGEEMLGYYYSKARTRRALKYAKGVDELFDDAHGAAGELGWRTYTSMSAHCRAAVNRYLNNPFITKVSPGDRPKLERLLELTALLGDVPLRGVRYINQVATALRFNFLLRALLEGQRDDRTVERVLSLYGEGASLAGFISTYRDVAVMNLLLAKFHGVGGAGAAAVYLDKSLRLAETVGDVPSVKRAVRLHRYFRVSALASRALRGGGS